MKIQDPTISVTFLGLLQVNFVNEDDKLLYLAKDTMEI